VRPQALLALRKDQAAPPLLVSAARRAIARLPVHVLRHSYFTTFWLPASPNRQPPRELESPIERLVAFLWRLADPPSSCSGVEWWIGRAHTNALPIGFHFDQDVKARRGFRHPLLSSVFFFNRVRGGQLAITDQVPGPRGEPRPAQASALEVIEPRRNRYVVFPGNLFHGVLDEEGRVPRSAARHARGRVRLTLVVNFWERRPTGVPLFGAGRVRVGRSRRRDALR
jgi:hypothetical protein